MGLDRLDAETEDIGSLPVAVTFGDQFNDTLLPVGQGPICSAAP